MSTEDLGRQEVKAAQGVPEEQRPRLARVDERALDTDQLERRRFGIVISSVYYYIKDSRLCCAVLLRMSFVLRYEERLEHAMVPLSAMAPKNANPDESVIDILRRYPRNEEWAEISKVIGDREVHMTPKIEVKAAGTGVKMGGIGTSWRTQDDHSYKIALKSFLKVVANAPTRLDWMFVDENGIFYPSDTDVIVLVTKTTEEHELYFPFELRLGWQFRVDIHGFLDRIKRSIRLVANADKHEGWVFTIKGNYCPDEAKKALDDIEAAESNGDTPKVVGLRAALGRWKDV